MPSRFGATRVCCVALLAVSLILAAQRHATADARADERALRIRTDRGRDGRGVEVNFVANVMAPIAAVERVLSDPAGYQEWLPRLKLVEKIEPLDDGARFETTMVLPWPIGAVHEHLVLKRRAHPGGVELTWEHEAGDMRRNDSRFTLVALSPERTEVRFNARLEFGQWLPMFAVDLAERLYTPWFLDSLQRRAIATLPSPATLTPVVAISPPQAAPAGDAGTPPDAIPAPPTPAVR